MRKLLLVIAGVLALAVTAGANPQDAQACRTVKCFNKQISVLKAQTRALNAQLQDLSTAFLCLKTAPVTSYFGYDYQGVADSTTALDSTASGDPVTFWVAAVQPGTCGKGSFASARSASSSNTSRAAGDGFFGPFQLGPSLRLTKP